MLQFPLELTAFDRLIDGPLQRRTRLLRLMDHFMSADSQVLGRVVPIGLMTDDNDRGTRLQTKKPLQNDFRFRNATVQNHDVELELTFAKRFDRLPGPTILQPNRKPLRWRHTPLDSFGVYLRQTMIQNVPHILLVLRECEKIA